MSWGLSLIWEYWMVRLMNWGPSEVRKIWSRGWDFSNAIQTCLKIYEDLRYETKYLRALDNKEDEQLGLPIWGPLKMQKGMSLKGFDPATYTRKLIACVLVLLLPFLVYISWRPHLGAPIRGLMGWLVHFYPQDPSKWEYKVSSLTWTFRGSLHDPATWSLWPSDSFSQPNT